MLSKLLTPFTTATAAGVSVRYITTILTTVIAIVGILGWLTPEQQEALTALVPGLLAAVSGLIAVLVPIYGVLTKSSSDKAAAVAKAVDAKVPAQAPVIIKTPAGKPDIVVSAP